MSYAYEKVRIGTKRLPPFQLLTQGRNHYDLISGAPVFGRLQPWLGELDAACNRLDSALRAFTGNPGPRELSERNAAYEELKNQIARIAAGVQSCSQGNPIIIRAGGFEVKLKRQPSQPLPAPERVLAKRTDYPGTIRVQWGAVKNRYIYSVWYTKSDPAIAEDWQLLTTTTRNHCLAEGLDSDHTYTFRVTATGVLGESPMSDITTAKAA